MSTFTKEQLIARINQVTAINKYRISRDTDADGLVMDNELFAIALASLEAEAVGYFGRFDADDEDLIDQCSQNIKGAFPLYAAPPAPVSVPDEKGKADDFELNGPLSCYQAGKIDGWNACRAAMLQGAEPVKTANKLPAYTPCKDAPEHIWLQTAGVWPENGEFSELTWCSDNQHKDDTLYVRADVVSGNSPVIPDGWVMVPVDMSPEMMRAVQINSELGAYSATNLTGAYSLFREFWDVAIAAAPRQEVK
ncbi:hypothetical protein [Enterobacter sp. LU1]|uniref:hypothetical protein n=1 Tax=Enterobacter sp. LU1 TaxID=1848517 RepID=UPI001FCAEB0E|nr:hypothetical protein [Enterobacter sp. LU1]